jgi:ribosome maturation factor RimP
LTETTRVERIITPSLEAMGFRVVRISFGGGGRPTLQIMAEPADGRPMSVEHCAEISRAVSALLDVDDPIPLAYTLEVTSPGIDRPLISRQDFERFAGFEAKVELARSRDGRKRFRGKLVGMEGDDVALDVEGERVAVPLAEVLRAKLLLTDELIKAVRDAQQGADNAAAEGGIIGVGQ